MSLLARRSFLVYTSGAITALAHPWAATERGPLAQDDEPTRDLIGAVLRRKHRAARRHADGHLAVLAAAPHQPSTRDPPERQAATTRRKFIGTRVS